MSIPERDILLDHDYDGIQELDNDLPPWWLKMFYVTIVFGVIYLIYYHFSGWGLTSSEEYLKATDPDWSRGGGHSTSYAYHSPWSVESADITPRILSTLGEFIGEDVSFEALIVEAKRRADENQLKLLSDAFPDADLVIAAKPKKTAPSEIVYEPVEMLTDATSLASGKEIYIKNCVACHGTMGEGGIGPNMADKYWIHGGSINDLVKIIRVGVPAKGMISWESTLPPAKITEVASYILTFQGTNPPNGKAKQGELYQP